MHAGDVVLNGGLDATMLAKIPFSSSLSLVVLFHVCRSTAAIVNSNFFVSHNMFDRGEFIVHGL